MKLNLQLRDRIRAVRSRIHEKRLPVRAFAVWGGGYTSSYFCVPGMLTASSNPAFCNVCHSMNPEIKTWQKSSHAQVPCYGCHGSRSYKELILGKMFTDSKVPLMELTGSFEQPVNGHSHVSQALIPMERCERCHNGKNRKFTFTKGIYMNHDKHKGAGIDCAVCHNRVVHAGAEKYEPLKTWDPKFKYKNFLTMKYGCSRCHSASPELRSEETLALVENGMKPPQACPTCHTEDFDLPGRTWQGDVEIRARGQSQAGHRLLHDLSQRKC